MDDIIKKLKDEENPETLLNNILLNIQNSIQSTMEDGKPLNESMARQVLENYTHELSVNLYDDIFAGSLFGYVYERTLECEKEKEEYYIYITRYFLENFASLNKEKIRKFFFTDKMLNDNEVAVSNLENLLNFVKEEYKMFEAKKLKTLVINTIITLAFMGYLANDLIKFCKEEHNNNFIRYLRSVINS